MGLFIIFGTSSAACIVSLFNLFKVLSDIVIFVNGIPIVLIECKSPYIREPILGAVEKNFQKYQRKFARAITTFKQLVW